MKARWVTKGLKVAAIAVLVVTVCGFVVMSLWNWLVPAIFGLRSITFWQAFGLLILSKILFGGFHGRHGQGGRWKGRMHDRWQQMTPEERHRFCNGMFGHSARPGGAAEGSPDPHHA
jgi:chromate transport protein ChrA